MAGRVPPSKGFAMFTDELMDSLRHIGDPPADAAVARYFEESTSSSMDLVRTLASAPAGVDEDEPGIGPFSTAPDPWPSWADPDLVHAGQQVFGEFGPQIGMALFMASLPADYAFAHGVQVLGATTRLTRDPKRRYVETGQMIIDAMTPGGLRPGARGHCSVRHVRIMHAAVRYLLLHPLELAELGGPDLGLWDQTLGVPINQLQLMGTLLSFSVQGIEGLGRIGVHLDGARAEAYIHTWNLIGWQMGVLPDLLPLGWADSRQLWDQRRKDEYGPTDAGRALTHAAIDAMRELFDLRLLPGLPATGIRHFLGDDTADLLGVPPADWTKAVFTVMEHSNAVIDLVLTKVPGTAPLAAALGRRLWRGFEAFRRSGTRPGFQVSDELRQAWGL